MTTSNVNTLKYKETVLAEFSDIGEDSQLTRYVYCMTITSKLVCTIWGWLVVTNLFIIMAGFHGLKFVGLPTSQEVL